MPPPPPQKANREVKEALRDAEESKASEAEIDALKKQLKETTYHFMSYNPQVIKFYTERYPFVGINSDIHLTHRYVLSFFRLN